MKISSTIIEDGFAEAFTMSFARFHVTAYDPYWLHRAVEQVCGYGTSVIGCDAEVGLECHHDETATLDGRPGASVMAFGFSAEALEKAITNRAGQCLMTCPTTAVFDGMPEVEQKIELGSRLRYFGDGFQKSKLLDQRRLWRVPVMDGEFLVEESIGVSEGVGGGNFLIQTIDQGSGLAAARRAVERINQIPGVITPFPGGVARSGSKVGSRYPSLPASTSEDYCPTLRGRVESRLHPEANCVYEIVIDGVDYDSVATAIAEGVTASIGDGVVSIGAGNYGGKLGKHHFHLHKLLSGQAS